MRQRVGIALVDPRPCRKVATGRYELYIRGAVCVAWGEDARWGKKRAGEVEVPVAWIIVAGGIHVFPRSIQKTQRRCGRIGQRPRVPGGYKPIVLTHFNVELSPGPAVLEWRCC